MISREFIENISAAEGLPMRLLATVILFSVVLALTAKAANSIISDSKEKYLMGELDLIETRAAVMYSNGGARDITDTDDIPGTKENIRVNIPDIASFVVFGAMPAGVPPVTRDPLAGNVYYYVLDNGRVQASSSIVRFSGNDTDLNSPFVLYPGEHDLTLELVKNRNGTFILME